MYKFKILIVFFSLVLSSAVFSASLSQKLAMAPQYHSIKAKASSSGSVDVIAKIKGSRSSFSYYMYSLRRLNLHPQETMPLLNTALFKVSSSQLDALLDSNMVLSLQEDILIEPHLAESIPFIRADFAHDNNLNGNGQIVVIMDTGVDTTHPFFTGKIVDEACFSRVDTARGIESVCPNGATEQLGAGASGCNVAGTCGHGTYVAGIAAAQSPNLNGVANGADIIAVHITSRFTSVDDCGSAANTPCLLGSTANWMRAIEWVAQHREVDRIAAVNLSFGGGEFQQACDNRFRPATDTINMLHNIGIPFVVSSGNDGFTNAISYPACITNALAVGASRTNNNQSLPTFSNSANLVEIIAPGDSVTSSSNGGGITTAAGTSAAAPHVTGAIAVLRNFNPNARLIDIERSLFNGGVDVTDPRNGLVFPRLDVQGALEELGFTDPINNPPIANEECQANRAGPAAAPRQGIVCEIANRWAASLNPGAPAFYCISGGAYPFSNGAGLGEIGGYVYRLGVPTGSERGRTLYEVCRSPAP